MMHRALDSIHIVQVMAWFTHQSTETTSRVSVAKRNLEESHFGVVCFFLLLADVARSPNKVNMIYITNVMQAQNHHKQNKYYRTIFMAATARCFNLVLWLLGQV